MIDEVFADELKRLVGTVQLGDTYLARWQRHAQLVFLAIDESQIDVDFLARLIAEVTIGHRCVVIAKILSCLSVIHEGFFAVHAVCSRKEFNLLGRIIGQCGGAAQGVKVILEERFLGKSCSRRRHRPHAVVGAHCRLGARLRALHITGHQFEFGIGESCAGLIYDRHPSPDIEFAGIRADTFGKGKVVIGPPGNTCRLVTETRLVHPGPRAGEIPYQRRLADESARQRRQPHGGVIADGAHAAVGHPQDQAALGTDEGSRDGFDGRASHLFDRHFTIKIFLQQFSRAGEVEFEALFQYPRSRRVGQRLEQHGGRVDQCRDVGNANGGSTLKQIDILRLPDHPIARYRIAFTPIAKCRGRQ